MCLELSIDIINDLAHTNPKQWVSVHAIVFDLFLSLNREIAVKC